MKDVTKHRGPLDSNTRESQPRVAPSGELHDNGHRLWDNAVNTAASAWTHERPHRSSLTAVHRGAVELTACRPHYQQLCTQALVLVSGWVQMYDSGDASQ